LRSSENYRRQESARETNAGLEAAQQPPEEAPRVLNLRAGAKYLGISYWSLRDLVLAGHVPAVRLPCPRARDGRMMRRMLVDRRDLDALIERSRERNG
jgi:hypothetical protein